MIPKSIRLVIRHIRPWIILSLIVSTIAGLGIGPDRPTSGAIWIMVYLALTCTSLISFSFLPIINSSIALPVKATAWFIQGLMITIAIPGLVVFLFLRLAIHGNLGTSLTEVILNLLIAIAAALILLRFAMLNPAMPGALFPSIMVQLSERSSSFINSGYFHTWAWPFYLIAIGIAVVEFPHFLNANDRGVATFRVTPPDVYGPKGPLPLTQLMNALLLVIFFGTIISVDLSRQLFADLRKFSLLPILTAILLGLLIYKFFTCRRAALACGLSPLSSIMYACAALIGIGYVFRYAIGVRDGTPIRCALCGKWRMIWMQQCPHCSNLSQSQSVPVPDLPRPALIDLTSFNPSTGDELQIIYRVGMTALLLFIWWFNALL